MKPRLFDASSILQLIRNKPDSSLDELEGAYILDLTLYEVGNALWKIHKLIRGAGEVSLFDSMAQVQSILATMIILPLGGVDDLTPISKIAFEGGLTFYDSAYLFAAKKRGLLLVTEDKLLLKAAIVQGVECSSV